MTCNHQESGLGHTDGVVAIQSGNMGYQDWTLTIDIVYVSATVAEELKRIIRDSEITKCVSAVFELYQRFAGIKKV